MPSSTAAGEARTDRAASDIEFAHDSVRIGRPSAFPRSPAGDPGARGRSGPAASSLRGHSDPVGVPAHNIDLAERRALVVKRYLVRRGAPADRIAVEAVGAADPADPRHTIAAWARNRRVEVLWR